MLVALVCLLIFFIVFFIVWIVYECSGPIYYFAEDEENEVYFERKMIIQTPLKEEKKLNGYGRIFIVNGRKYQTYDYEYYSSNTLPSKKNNIAYPQINYIDYRNKVESRK